MDRNKYHVAFEDTASGESLGLILTEDGGIGRIARLANPYAAKVGSGDRSLSDLTDLSVYGQTDWASGRGQDIFEVEDRYFDARAVETRIKGQVTLGPQVHVTGIAAAPEYTPTETVAAPVGRLSQSYTHRAQSFTVGASNITCTHVRLLLRVHGYSPTSTATITVRIETDSTGLPSGTLVDANATKTVNLSDLGTSFEDYKVRFPASFTLTASTKYHIVVNWDQALSESEYAEWASTGSGTYSDGTACSKQRKWAVGASDIGGSDKIDSASWVQAGGWDRWFIVNDGSVLAGNVTVNFVRFDDKWWCAAGDTVYYWDTGTGYWVSSEVQAGETVTDMVVWGGYLWVARGANTMRRYDGSTWSDAPGTVQARYLCEYQGYLYRSAPNNYDLYYTSDGTTWSSTIQVGPTDWGITRIVGFRDYVAVLKVVGLWLIAGDYAYQVLDWKSLEESTNGQKALVWAKTNELFIPIGFGLYRWSGATMVSCGPDQDAGLPANRAGKIASLCATVNWLFAAVDAGSGKYSSILAWDGRGWHPIIRSTRPGERIRALGYETISSPPRLWWAENDSVFYVELPDYSDNPYAYSGITFQEDGELETSAWGSELLNVEKDWRAVVLQVENCTSARTIEVYAEVDRSGVWQYVGKAADSRSIHTLEFPTSSFANKTTGSGSTTTTVELAAGYTTGDMSVGDWVRISAETRQVASITDSNTFTLTTALSTAPASGVTVYPASPLGHELRLRLRLTTDDETETPKLLALAVYCDANVTDRWVIDLRIRCEDGIRCLDGSPYPMDAETLASQLESWVNRATAFTLHDMRGETRTVKVANAVEHSVRRTDGPEIKYSSIYQVNLVEVNIG